MKRLVFTLVAFALFVIKSISQGTSDNATLAKYYRLDFAVPDQPAFKILGINPSDILRPSTVTDLSVVTSNFIKGKSIVLPQSFALEVAPILLAKSNSITLDEYEKKKIWHSLRLSLGSQTISDDTTTNNKLALGARITLIDNGDQKSDRNFINEVIKLTAEKTELENILKIEYLNSIGKSIYDYATDTVVARNTEMYILENLEKYQDLLYDKRLKKLKEDYKNENWNKQKLDIAVAILNESPDSLAKNIKFNSFGLWGTYALPVKKWGQILIGFNYHYSSFDSLIVDLGTTKSFSLNKLTIASRFYCGTNRIKGFIEGQYYYQDSNSTNNALINLGAEINLMDGLWINLNAGYDYNNLFNKSNSSDLFVNFDLRFQIPEKFNL